MCHEIQDAFWKTLKKVHQPGTGIQKHEPQVLQGTRRKWENASSLQIAHKLRDHSHTN